MMIYALEQEVTTGKYTYFTCFHVITIKRKRTLGVETNGGVQ